MLIATYLVVVSGICALLLASVAWTLWHHRRPAPDRTRIDPQNVEELIQCNADLTRLVDSLQDELCTLRQVDGSGRTPMMQSEAAARWQATWSSLGARCRFEELKRSGQGVLFDHMAAVHGELLDLRQALDRDAAKAWEIRTALDANKGRLDARRAGMEEP